MPTVCQLLTQLSQITPEILAEDWDNVGLLIGRPENETRRILLALDPALALLEQAVRGDYDLIITHHPAIFRPLKALRTDTPAGRFIAGAARANLTVIACHTNFDAIPGGVSDLLARSLGLVDCAPLVSSAGGCGASSGIGRIGMLSPPLTCEEFLDRIRVATDPPWLLEAGPRPAVVARVAVCGGSCSDLAEHARSLGAEVFLTAEIKHSVARWAEEAGLWLLDGGHFATEYPAMAAFCERLRRMAADQGWDLTIDLARQEPPLRLVP